MAGSVTLNAEAHAVANSAYGGAGDGQHMPVGYDWLSTEYVSALRFPQPSWSGWTAITKATLTLYSDGFAHIAPHGGTITVSRQNVSGLWTKAAGTYVCEGLGSDNNTLVGDLADTSTDRATFDATTASDAPYSIIVTAALQYYFAQNASKLVFVLEPYGLTESVEFWSSLAAGVHAGLRPTLTIEYDTGVAPSAPTLDYPASGATVTEVQPDFDWTPSGPDAQTNAEVQLWNAAGTTLLNTFSVAGSTSHLVCPTTLTRGTGYQFAVRTQSAVGWGPFSGKRAFTVAAVATLTMDPVRRMVFANGAPRLVVQWSPTTDQTYYRVLSGSYDSGAIAGSASSFVLSSVDLVYGASTSVVVQSLTPAGTQTAGQLFTPRWGLTTHRKDMGAAPVNWGVPVIDASVPTGASLVFEYGSNSTAAAAPTAWYANLSLVPKDRYVFWRAWFIPSDTAGPILARNVIPADFGVLLVDKWGTTRDTSGLNAPWNLDSGEAVYGTRSLTVDVTGGGPFYVYSYGMPVRAGRSYILTGLMKSLGNSGAQFMLTDSTGAILTGGGVIEPVGPVQSERLTATKDWFDVNRVDVNRYRTPVFRAPSDMTVYATCRAGGAGGSKAWFDALKLEESSVATPWSPAAIGATVIDAGGVQVDGFRGGVLRYRGSNGNTRDNVEGAAHGLMIGTDTELYSPTPGLLFANSQQIAFVGDITSVSPAPTNPVIRVYTTSASWNKPANLDYIMVEVVGGGGASGGNPATSAGQEAASGSGGGGAYSRKIYRAVDLPASATAIPAGGGGANSGAAGSAGGNSSFSGTGITTVFGQGGAGGQPGVASSTDTSVAGGAGGGGATGDFSSDGEAGAPGFVRSGRAGPLALRGGSSIFAGYGYGGAGVTSTASQAAKAGTAGAGGVVIVTEHLMPVGLAGPQGAQGVPGVKGDTGSIGPPGAPGTNGATGPAGAPGSAGATGPAGPKGDQGDPGTTGAQGPAGTPGAPGATGSTGAIGPQGPIGPQGSQGPQGLQGSTGAASTIPGPEGPTGPAGPKGEQGDTGPMGPQGVQGPIGPAGSGGGGGGSSLTGGVHVSQLVIDGDGASVSMGAGTVDPSVAPGVAAPPGSTYYQSTGTSGTQWVKTGPLDTDWEQSIEPPLKQAISIIIDGGGAVIGTGIKGAAKVPADSRIDAWELVSVDNTSGSIVVELWQDTFPNFPPTSADMIGASEKPTLASQTKNSDASLNGGAGYAIPGGNWIMWNVASAAAVKIVALALSLTRT